MNLHRLDLVYCKLHSQEGAQGRELVLPSINFGTYYVESRVSWDFESVSEAVLFLTTLLCASWEGILLTNTKVSL